MFSPPHALALSFLLKENLHCFLMLKWKSVKIQTNQYPLENHLVKFYFFLVNFIIISPGFAEAQFKLNQGTSVSGKTGVTLPLNYSQLEVKIGEPEL